MSQCSEKLIIIKLVLTPFQNWRSFGNMFQLLTNNTQLNFYYWNIFFKLQSFTFKNSIGILESAVIEV